MKPMEISHLHELLVCWSSPREHRGEEEERRGHRGSVCTAAWITAVAVRHHDLCERAAPAAMCFIPGALCRFIHLSLQRFGRVPAPSQSQYCRGMNFSWIIWRPIFYLLQPRKKKHLCTVGDCRAQSLPSCSSLSTTMEVDGELINSHWL